MFFFSDILPQLFSFRTTEAKDGDTFKFLATFLSSNIEKTKKPGFPISNQS